MAAPRGPGSAGRRRSRTGTGAPRSVRLVLALLLVLGPALAACSDDDGPASGGTDPSTTTVPEEPDEPGPDGEEPDLHQDLLPVYLEDIGRAMEPELTEVDGDLVRIHLAEGNPKVPVGTECLIVASFAPEGLTTVIERGERTLECPAAG